MFYLFALLLISPSRQRDSVASGAESLQRSSWMSLNKADLNIAEPEIKTSHQSKRKIMGSVRFLKAGVVLSFL